MTVARRWRWLAAAALALAACGDEDPDPAIDASGDAADGKRDGADAGAALDGAGEAGAGIAGDAAEGGPDDAPADTPAPDAADAAPGEAGFDLPAGDVPLPPGLSGIARLIGQSQHGGTRVELVGTGPMTTTDADGIFTLGERPDGMHVLQLGQGEYWDRLPLLISGGRPFVAPNVPLPPLELPRARRLIDGDYDGRWLPTPDGTAIIHSTWTPTAAPIEVTSLPDGSTKVVAPQARSFPRLSSDGRRLIFLEGGAGTSQSPANLVSMRLDGSDRVQLASGVTVWHDTFIAPGGPAADRIVFWQGAYDAPGGLTLLATPVDRSAVVTLATGLRVVNLYRVSPDGRWLAMYVVTQPTSLDAEIRVINLETGATTFSARLYSGGFSNTRFTKDSKRVLYGEGRLFSVPVEGGPALDLGVSPSVYALSADETLALVHKPFEGLRDVLWVVPVAGGEARRISQEEVYGSFHDHRFSPDNKWVVFETLQALKAASTSALDVRILTTMDTSGVVGFSPDGQRVIYRVFRSGSPGDDYYLAALDAATPPVKILTGSSGAKLSPDGRYLVGVERGPLGTFTGTLVIVSLADGQRRVVGPAGFISYEEQTFTADSQWMVFRGEMGGLRLLRLPDGTPSTLTDVRMTFPRGFAPDGSRVLFAADGVLHAARVDTRATTAIARGAGDRMVWVGSGQLLFQIKDAAPATIWRTGVYRAVVP